jgi:hypothetical protein
MPPTDDSASFQAKATAPEKRKPGASPAAAEPAASPDLVTLTLDAGTGKIVKVERIDASGAHHEITGDEGARPAAEKISAALQQVVEQAFQAGIDCVLGADDEDEEPGVEADAEADEDAELNRLLLRSLIQRSAARKLIGRDMLRQVIVGSLVEQAAAFRAASTESAAAH